MLICHADRLTSLFQAFKLATEYLQIRPLLDVEDMLRDKPDKRSVITYVSQFIRSSVPSGQIAAGPLIDDHTLIVWMEATLNTLRSTLSAPVFDQYEVNTPSKTIGIFFKHVSLY